MKRFLFLLASLLFPVSCTPSAEDLVSDLLDDYEEEYYPCYPGDARLPIGSHPEYLVTPEGYVWECDESGDVYLNSNGTFSVVLSSSRYSESRDYYNDCPGSASREEEGEWIVASGRLCWKYDNIQPGTYSCQRFSYDSDAFSFLGSVNYYDENGSSLGSDYSPDTCTLEEE